MEEHIFCSKCGWKMINIERAEYDRYTGKKVFDLECETRLCDHDGIDHVWRPASGFFSFFSFFSFFKNYDKVCRKCGDTSSYGDRL